MKEIKSLTVAPSEEEATINLWQSFGWELKSTQEVKTQDVQTFTGQDNDGTEHYRTTKGEHYIKLTFEREKSNPSYAELCDLEQKYYAAAKMSLGAEPAEPKKGLGCWVWGFSILAVLVGALTMGTQVGAGIIFIIVGAAIFTIGMMVSKSAYPKKHAIWEKVRDEYNQARDEYNQAKKMMPEIIERARSLLG